MCHIYICVKYVCVKSSGIYSCAATGIYVCACGSGASTGICVYICVRKIYVQSCVQSPWAVPGQLTSSSNKHIYI